MLLFTSFSMSFPLNISSAQQTQVIKLFGMAAPSSCRELDAGREMDAGGLSPQDMETCGDILLFCFVSMDSVVCVHVLYTWVGCVQDSVVTAHVLYTWLKPEKQFLGVRTEKWIQSWGEAVKGESSFLVKT